MIKTKAIWLGIAIWIIITVVFSKSDAPSDGFTSIGFPLHFYSYTGGKLSSGSYINNGVILTYLLVDFIALIVFIVLLHIILLSRRKPFKIQL